jgi:hypothetical protein
MSTPTEESLALIAQRLGEIVELLKPPHPPDTSPPAEESSPGRPSCPVCGQEKRVDQFLLDVDGGRSLDACRACRAKRERYKYWQLTVHLCDLTEDRLEMTFAEIEELGFTLPPSCRTHVPHWFGTTGSAVARAIRAAGWRASRPNLAEETVTFERNFGD